MALPFSINILQVVDLLGIDREADRGTTALNCRCPFCGGTERKKHMNINMSSQTFHCFKCGSGGGALELYSQVRYGVSIVKGQNSKEMYKKLKEELGQSIDRPEYAKRTYKEIEPADDAVTDAVYSAMLNLPYFALSEEHKQNLRKRGLDEEAIVRGGYASIDPNRIIEGHKLRKSVEAFLATEEVKEELKQQPILNKMDRKCLVAGLIVASELKAKGLSVDAVSGFYTLHGKKCLRISATGMMIPARNSNGQIFGIQTRKDVITKGPRYITLSSKGLPGGPTVRICRTHFSIFNAQLNSETRFVLTEGPLKSDVATSLFRRSGLDNIAFCGIPGVNNTADLKEIGEYLKEQGIGKIYLALDMDKTTNLSVAKAGRAIRSIFNELGIAAIPLCWDIDYAYEKEAQMLTECRKRSLNFRFGENPYENIGYMTQALNTVGVTVPAESRWSPKTKGIDDYLVHCLTATN